MVEIDSSSDGNPATSAFLNAKKHNDSSWSRVFRKPGGSWLSRLRGDSPDRCASHSPNTWLAALNGQLKRQRREFHKADAQSQNRISFPKAPISTLTIADPSQQFEIDVLRLTVAGLRKELRASHAREMHARFLAAHDDLTGLLNRRCFLERLGTAIKSDMADCAVFILDLDGFKALNDAHGHAAGDQILRIIAARLASCVRAEDFVSRLSGDEFACLISSMSRRENLHTLALNMFRAVSEPLTVDYHQVTVKASIGVAVWPIDGRTMETLMDAADQAMYFAKRERADVCFFSDRHRNYPPT